MTKILLVEDDKSLREIYGVRLLAEGYDIVSAGDGEEALAMAIKERPNLIVSDVMMPKISGFDMLDILRSTTETRGIKVIMMTALSSEDQRRRGEELGADRYLVKSQVGIEDVVRTVHEVLGDGDITPEERTANKEVPYHPEEISTENQAPAIQQEAPQVQTQQSAPQQQQAPIQQQPMRPAPTLNAERPQPQLVPVSQQFSRPQPPMPTRPTEAPQQPVAATPAPHQTPAAPQQTQAQPEQTNSLPKPVAPFSTDRPQGSGERVLHPVTDIQERDDNAEALAHKMDDILNNMPQTEAFQVQQPAPQQLQQVTVQQPPMPTQQTQQAPQQSQGEQMFGPQ